LNLEQGDYITAFINVDNLTEEEYIKTNHIVFCTRKGRIKKSSLEAYSRPRQKGITAITLQEGDELISAQLTNGKNDIMLAVKSGKSIRFHEEKIRSMGRTASGVRGITLANPDDEVVGMVCVENPESHVMVVSEKGYGKRSELNDYRITNRGGKGVKTMNVSEKTGQLIAVMAVTDEDDLMIINRSGTLLRLAVSDIRVTGRTAQGVRLINIREGDSISAVINVPAGSKDFNAEEDDENADVVSE
jgi:DNA gyrase subunit A